VVVLEPSDLDAVDVEILSYACLNSKLKGVPLIVIVLSGSFLRLPSNTSPNSDIWLTIFETDFSVISFIVEFKETNSCLFSSEVH